MNPKNMLITLSAMLLVVVMSVGVLAEVVDVAKTYNYNNVIGFMSFAYPQSITQLTEAEQIYGRDLGYPTIAIGNTTANCEHFREIGNILYDVSDSPKYRITYTCYNGTYAEYNTGIGYAYSNDGVSWTDYGNLTNLTMNLEDPYVIKLNSTHWMMYAENKTNPFNNTVMFISDNFINWTFVGAAIVPGTENWEAKDVSSPVVFIYDEVFYMYYEGRGFGSVNTNAIGLANSSNGINWTKIGKTNIVAGGSPYQTEEGHNVPDDIIDMGDYYYFIWHANSYYRGMAPYFGIIEKTNLSHIIILNNSNIGVADEGSEFGYYVADTIMAFKDTTDFSVMKWAYVPLYPYTGQNDKIAVGKLTTDGYSNILNHNDSYTQRGNITFFDSGIFKDELFFDGAGDKLRIRHFENESKTMLEGTICMDVRLNITGKTQGLIGNRKSTSDTYWLDLHVGSDDELWWGCKNDTTEFRIFSNGQKLLKNEHYQVCAVWNSTGLYTYLNGVLDQSSTTQKCNFIKQTAEQMYLGTYFSWSDGFTLNGSLSNLIIFNTSIIPNLNKTYHNKSSTAFRYDNAYKSFAFDRFVFNNITTYPYIIGSLASTITYANGNFTTESKTYIYECIGTGNTVHYIAPTHGTYGWTAVYHNGVFVEYTNADTYTTTTCSTWEFRTTEYSGIEDVIARAEYDTMAGVNAFALKFGLVFTTAISIILFGVVIGIRNQNISASEVQAQMGLFAKVVFYAIFVVLVIGILIAALG